MLANFAYLIIEVLILLSCALLPSALMYWRKTIHNGETNNGQ